MHPLPPEALESFKKAYAASFDHEIDDVKAEKLATTLLDTLGTAHRPM